MRMIAMTVFLTSLVLAATTPCSAQPAYTVGKVSAKWDDWGGCSYPGNGYYNWVTDYVFVLPSGWSSFRFAVDYRYENTSWTWSRDFKGYFRVYRVIPPAVDGGSEQLVSEYSGTNSYSGRGTVSGSWMIANPISLGTDIFRFYEIQIKAEIVGKGDSGWKKKRVVHFVTVVLWVGTKGKEKQ